MNKIIEHLLFLHNSDIILDYRNKFCIPTHFISKKEVIYFCGNSLGLKPKSVDQYVLNELADWGNLGVEGHFKESKPWVSYHKSSSLQISKLIGANPQEVVVMNALSVNLHLLMATFYRPKPSRYRILIEKGAFPSDQYIVDSQAKFHRYNPKNAIIEVENTNKNGVFNTNDILNAIEMNKDSIALILLGAVNYYTGQVLDIKKIANLANEYDITIGFDFAHAIGNISLNVNEYNIDFATWCSYKYLNAGPGGVSGIYINKKHFYNKDLPRLEGWWGSDEASRFQMNRKFESSFGAQAWQLSNAPVLSIAALSASLDIFESVGMEKLVSKSKIMFQMLHLGLTWLIENIDTCNLEIITPKMEGEYGCQISILVEHNGKELFNYLHSNYVIVDWRNPNVIRIAPVSLYNTFEDISDFLLILKKYYL